MSIRGILRRPLVRWRTLRQRPPDAGSLAPPRSRRPAPLSVVVTAHNKAPWLAQTLACVAAQTVRPAEVLVVDDASSDGTAAVAAEAGVRCERVEYRSPALARNHGAALVNGDYVFFLDGDDLVGRDFLALQLDALERTPHAGFAYGRIREFGTRNELWPEQSWDHDALRRWNYVPAATVVRRDAFEDVGGYPDLSQAEDWGLWLRLSAAGRPGVPSPAVWFWQRTPESRNARRTWGRPRTWFEEAPHSCMSVAIFSPLAGKRAVLDRWFATLDGITWPRARVEIWLYDNSGDDAFHQDVRGRAERLSGFRAVHVVRDDDALPGYAELARQRAALDRHQATVPFVSERVARIYSWAARNVEADFVAFLEDDVVPERGGAFLSDLLRAVGWETQAVLGWYRSRLGNILVVEPPKPWQRWAWRTYDEPQEGVTRVAGGGTGCALFRREVLRGRDFRTGGPYEGADLVLSRDLWREGREMLCNWDVACQHVVD